MPVLEDPALDFGNRDAVFEACRAKAEELGKRMAGCSTPWAWHSLASSAPRRRCRSGLHDGPGKDPGACPPGHCQAERLILAASEQENAADLRPAPRAGRFARPACKNMKNHTLNRRKDENFRWESIYTQCYGQAAFAVL